MKQLAVLVAATGLLLIVYGSGESVSTGDAGCELRWFQDDFAAASAAADSAGKPLLIEIYENSCRPCRTLSQDYFTAPEIVSSLGSFVLLRVEARSVAGLPIAERYGVTTTPCVVIARADGTEIDRIVGLPPSVGQYSSELSAILADVN